MKFSIITVTYNSSATIEKTILSVISQTYRDYEYNVIDGGSVDGTKDVIDKYKDYISYWKSEPDNGIYDAMNKAIEHANGDWFFFINSDDVFCNNEILESVSKKILSKKVVYYGDVLMTPGNNIYLGEFDKRKICMTNICHQAIFYPKEVFYKYKYETKYRLYADWYLNIKCMADIDFRFEYLSEVISVFDIGGTSSSHNDSLFKSDYYNIIKSNFGFKYYLYLFFLHYKKCLL